MGVASIASALDASGLDRARPHFSVCVMDQPRAVAFEIPEKLALEAEALGLDVTEASRDGLWLIMRQKRREAEWREENKEAVVAWNEWFEKNGLPLEEYRLF